MGLKKGKILETTIEKLAYGGKGISRIDDFVVFVPYTVPGDTVRIKISRKKKSYAEARLLEVLQPSPMRKEAPCRYFGQCGGCKWQNISYDNQLQTKQNIVRESLEHIAGFKAEVEPVLGAADPFHYRNKMEFTFSNVRWLLPDELENKELSKKNAVGFHAPGAYDRVMDIDTCLLQEPVMDAILNDVRQYALTNNIPYYNFRDHSGVLRFLVIRKTRFTNQIMVNIVTASDSRTLLQPLADQLMVSHPDIKSVVNGVNERPAQVAFADVVHVLAGEPSITEQLGEFKFIISPNSFFQTNSAQALVLYNTVRQFAGLTGEEIVWDLYGGTGTIGIFLAQQARKVINIELIDSAVADGRLNVQLNGINNVEFVHGDMRDIISSIPDAPHVIVTDPPRDGMHRTVVDEILNRAPGRIVYVSCNPTTMARDLEPLLELYTVKKIQPVDMFPQTYHIETVALLEKKNAG